ECEGNVCVEGSGDGDGDPTGDGDGDGDGEPTGDGDGDPTGDGDGEPTGDGDGEPECPNANEMMCDGECIDVMANVENCGECGNVCGVANDMSLGGCTEGQCDPFWSECYEEQDGFTTCDQICENEDKTCITWGCGGYTTTQGAGQSFCIAKNLGGSNGENACGSPLTWTDAVIMCCCQ